MNRITERLQQKSEGKILSLYFTAGYPEREDSVPIIRELERQGVDMIEIGLPFSDPLADGPTIQESSRIALQHGMTTSKLFAELEGIRTTVSIPLLIMGYFNPILQYGVEAFCQKCQETGIDGLIIPDLPLEEYNLYYRELFDKYGLVMVFLITPQTSEKRIREIDQASKGFIYMVSSASVTGSTGGFGPEQKAYFERIAKMNLRSPLIVGFGISDAQSFQEATTHTQGAIIGSAFINQLTRHGIQGSGDFVRRIRGV